MSQGKSKRGGSKTREAHGEERIRSVLVPIDLSAMADRVLGRVARLPLANGARITLLHVVPKELLGLARQRAESDAAKALAAEARALAKALPKHTHVETEVRLGSAAKEIAKAAKAAKAELIVIGRGGKRALRDVFLGSTAERVIRLGQLPVLAVRLSPRAPYARPAVALELDDSARDIIETMLHVLSRPAPRVTLIHALDTPYHGVYPSLTDDEAESFRDKHTRKATQQLTRLFTSSVASARPEAMPPYRAHVRCGSARLVIEKAVEKAESDLLALGTHGYSGLAHVLLGTVAGDVLREVACDVLVTPGPR